MRVTPAWLTGWPRPWRLTGYRRPSWRNHLSATPTRSPAPAAERGCRPPLSRRRTDGRREDSRAGQRAGCQIRVDFTVLRQNAAVEPSPEPGGSRSTPIGADIREVNLQFYWVLAQFNICWGKVGSGP